MLAARMLPRRCTLTRGDWRYGPPLEDLDEATDASRVSAGDTQCKDDPVRGKRGASCPPGRVTATAPAWGMWTVPEAGSCAP